MSREWREYERTSTAVLSAYVYPTASAYLEALQAGLESSGYRGSPFVMQSNGGITTIEQAKANPITMIEAGPASGIFKSEEPTSELQTLMRISYSDFSLTKKKH